MAPSPSEYERQRIEHLVLGRARPKPAPGRKTRRSKGAGTVVLAPGIEEQVKLHEEWGRWAGTPQTERHAVLGQREGSLARLVRSGAIDAGQHAAAESIAGVHAQIAADVNVRTASLETRIDSGQRGGGAAFETFAQIRREQAYTAWRRALGGDAAVVLAMIVEDLGVTIAASRHGMHVRRAKRLLIEALDAWIHAITGARPVRTA